MKYGERIMLVVVSILSACLLIILGLLFVWSPGKTRPFTDESGRPLAGSISEKIHVPINGVEQGMFLRGRDRAKPVLLFLHGGPGLPEYFLTRNYPTGLEDDFTVCWWDQRGAGLSFSPDIPPETLTVEQLISDTLEVANYLRKRFGRDKIYLLGHSGGSFIAIQAAARAPELFHAYIGVAQMSRQLESEKLAYRYMVEQFTKAGDKRMLNKLGKFPIPEMNAAPNSYRSLRDEAMHKLGVGTTRKMRSVVRGIFLPSLRNPEYTLREKIALWCGKWSRHSGSMWQHMLATDLEAEIVKLDLPVYFFHGRRDYTVSYPLAKGYLEKLQVPLKGFYTFERSAHSPIFEEPENVRRILQEDVLAGVNNLADRK